MRKSMFHAKVYEKKICIAVVRGNCLYILELTVGFETNLHINYERKNQSYCDLITSLRASYDSVDYMNLSMSALGCVSKESKNLPKWLNSLGLSDSEIKYTIRKTVKICMRTSYYIFCRRNCDWSSPELLDW